MKKRIIASSLLMAVLATGVISVQAATPKIGKYYPYLSFSDSRATCSASISDFSARSISATMELCQGSTPIASWYDSGTTYVSFDESATVSRGKTYTLKLTYTIDGVTETTSTSAYCS